VVKKKNNFRKYIESRTKAELEEIFVAYDKCNNDCNNCILSNIIEDDNLLCAVFTTVMHEYIYNAIHK
jgi:hypothetical protein